MNALSTPSITGDASVRAWRTLAQGLVFDLAAGATGALVVGIAPGIEWTSVYWQALGAAAAKSVLVAGVAYLARLFVPPASAPTTRGGA